MADISKITLPSGNTYELKDAVAREMISGGISFIVAWDGTSTPVPASIPAGVKVTYQGTTYTGTLSAETEGTDPHAQAGAFYLVKSATNPTSETLDVYDEYVPVGTTGSKFWEKIGDTKIDLTDVVTGVTLNKSTDSALGDGTTFTNSTSTVTFGAHTKDKVLGENTTFSVTDPTVTVTPSTTYVKATASGTAIGSDGTANAVTGYANTTSDANSVTNIDVKLLGLNSYSVTNPNTTEFDYIKTDPTEIEDSKYSDMSIKESTLTITKKNTNNVNPVTFTINGLNVNGTKVMQKNIVINSDKVSCYCDCNQYNRCQCDVEEFKYKQEFSDCTSYSYNCNSHCSANENYKECSGHSTCISVNTCNGHVASRYCTSNTLDTCGSQCGSNGCNVDLNLNIVHLIQMIHVVVNVVLMDVILMCIHVLQNGMENFILI